MINLLGLLLAMAIVSGCARGLRSTENAGMDPRTDIFQEVSTEGNIPKGYADLIIYSSLKTHKPGTYLLDDLFGNKKGTPDYMLLISIDGQITKTRGILKEEDIGTWVQNSEAGKGIRYVFRINLRLKAGTHRLIVALPEDGIAIEKDMKLTDGTKNLMQLVPQYRGTESVVKSRPTVIKMREPSFTNGMRGFDVLLNWNSL